MGRSKKKSNVKQVRPKAKAPWGFILFALFVVMCFHGCVVKAQRILQVRSCDPVREDEAQYAACRDSISYFFVLTKKPEEVLRALD